MKAWKIVLPALILAVGVAGAGLLFATRPEVEAVPPPSTAPLVRVETAAPRAVQLVVESQGTVAPRTESDLVPQVSGEVVWLSPSLASGGSFEAGDPLLRIERADYEVELESARAARARAASEHDRARKELKRQRALADRNVASQARIDDAENAARVAEAVLREARARVTRAQRDLERTEIRAPYAGRVRDERVDVGQFVSRGESVASLYAVDFAEVRLPLPDRELAFVDLPLVPRDADEETAGPEVTLRAEFAGKHHAWSGRIVRTEGEIDPRTRMVHAVARVEDPYGRLREDERPPLAVGLFVTAEIQGREVEQAVLLPRSAIREGDRVLVVEGERLHFRDVDVVRVQGDHAVIGGGLSAGEQVCVTPLAGAVDGMAVRLAEQGAALVRSGP